MHGPLAMATVDPAVVHLDMHCVPGDRWHGVVLFIDNMTCVVRKGLKARKIGEVSPTACICPATVQLFLEAYAGICLHMPAVWAKVPCIICWHMPGISHRSL